MNPKFAQPVLTEVPATTTSTQTATTTKTSTVTFTSTSTTTTVTNPCLAVDPPGQVQRRYRQNRPLLAGAQKGNDGLTPTIHPQWFPLRESPCSFTHSLLSTRKITFAKIKGCSWQVPRFGFTQATTIALLQLFLGYPPAIRRHESNQSA